MCCWYNVWDGMVRNEVQGIVRGLFVEDHISQISVNHLWKQSSWAWKPCQLVCATFPVLYWSDRWVLDLSSYLLSKWTDKKRKKGFQQNSHVVQYDFWYIVLAAAWKMDLRKVKVENKNSISTSTPQSSFNIYWGAKQTQENKGPSFIWI